MPVLALMREDNCGDWEVLIMGPSAEQGNQPYLGST